MGFHIASWQGSQVEVIKRPTTIVVGAGASADFGLPLGNELKARIARALDIHYADFGRQLDRGSLRVVDALRQLGANNYRDSSVNRFLPSCRAIAQAMPLALSIDNYLDAHRDDRDTVECGKIAIVEAILQAERESRLYIEPWGNCSLQFDQLEDTWLNRLSKLVTESVTRSELHLLFQNLTIVSFNYDRCIKQFLKDSIKVYYRVSEDESVSILRNLCVIHPYGSVGVLPWESQATGTCFGTDASPKELLDLSFGIRTFTERVADESISGLLQAAVEHSELVFFLGFAFHPQNLALLRPKGPSAVRRVFGTSLGISAYDQDLITVELQAMFSQGGHHTAVRLLGGNSVYLFDNVGRALTS